MTVHRCDRPPLGWECSLPYGHFGPCPSYPSPLWLPTSAKLPKRRLQTVSAIRQSDPFSVLGDYRWERQLEMAKWDVSRFARTLWTITIADLDISSRDLAKKGVTKDMGGIRTEVETAQKATLISSKRADGSHAVTLDIDHPAEIIPSSTEGHFHLYIDVAMEWWRYKLLLRVLAFCGVIEKGYAVASIKKGGTFLRLPWIKKPVAYKVKL